MTREIKIQVWDTVKKEMSLGMPLPMLAGYLHGIYPNLGNEIYREYTGLKDKNGVEIYEGDILRLHCGSEDGATERHKINAEVLWREDRFVALIPDKIVKVKGGSQEGKMLSWREIHTWCGMHTCLTQWQSKLEVIGNIYQNPELLQ